MHQALATTTVVLHSNSSASKSLLFASAHNMSPTLRIEAADPSPLVGSLLLAERRCPERQAMPTSFVASVPVSSVAGMPHGIKQVFQPH